MSALIVLALLAAPAPVAKPMATLSHSNCMGGCPAYTVSVYPDGRVVYRGKANVATPGKREAQLAPENAQALVQAFHDAKFFTRKLRQLPRQMDLGTETITFREGERSRTVDVGSVDDRAVRELERKFEELTGAKRWVTGSSK